MDITKHPNPAYSIAPYSLSQPEILVGFAFFGGSFVERLLQLYSKPVPFCL
jgi:hypothetical protein